MSRIESKKKNVRKCKKSQKEKNTKVKESLPEQLLKHSNCIAFTNKKVDPKSRWVVFELAEDITFAEHSVSIEQSIYILLGPDAEYFVPYYKDKVNDKIASLILFEGYFYVKSDPKILQCPDKFQNEYIKGPLKERRVVAERPGSEINRFKKGLQEKLKELVPKKKQIVIPKVGIFSNLEGEVIDVDRKNLIAIVKFQYSTRIVEAPISFINLTLK